MITDVPTLIELCSNELSYRGYTKQITNCYKNHWNQLAEWMKSRQISEFSHDIADRYLDDKIGTHLFSRGMAERDRLHLRAIRMLISYQKDGDFEFRSPMAEYTFKSDYKKQMLDFLDNAGVMLHRADNTVLRYKITLRKFDRFLTAKKLNLLDIGIDDLEAYFKQNSETLNIRHSDANCLRQFFRYLYKISFTEKDLSVFILKDNLNRHSDIPTTYTEDEIRKIIDAPDRSSAIGKRDYLVLLLAAQYGWRSADITGFRLDQIDWEKNVIRFSQQKTGFPVEYPLLASVGNAVIDYLRHGRPKSERKEIILSAQQSKYGRPLTSPAIHAIVRKYMEKANITGWKEKKHGAHSLRHSLASNLLKKNVSLPVISTVLGHQQTETTKIYLKVDTENLKACPLKMPELKSPYYTDGGHSYE